MLAAASGLLARAVAQSRAWSSVPGQLLCATAIRVLQGGKTLEVLFNTGESYSLPAEYLRVESPAASNRDTLDARGRPKVPHGRRNVGIIDVQPVGSYAIRLGFDDLHTSGIYTWQYLRELATHKRPRMRRYLAALRAQGLSRDPQRSRRRRAPPGGAAAGSSGSGGGGGGGSGARHGSSAGPG